MSFLNERRCSKLLGSRLHRPWLACLLVFFVVVPCAHAHESLLLSITTVTRAIDSAPQDESLYLQRAELHRLHHDWDAARSDLERAAALAPELAVVDFYRGRLLLEERRLQQALAILSRYLEQHPGHAQARLSRARTLAALERPLEAVTDYSIALEQYPTPELYLERSDVLASGGDEQLAAALAGLDEGMDKLGPLPAFELRSVDYELRRGDIEAALRRVDRAVARSAHKSLWLLRRAEILERANRPDEAVLDYQAAYAAVLQLPEHRQRTQMFQDLETRIAVALKRLSERSNTMN
jgi:tetratricopeptide (TPR) repeat protein